MAPGRTFQRQSLLQRGHFTNHPTFFPVLRLQFGPSDLEVKTPLRRERISYSSLSAEVRERHIFKSYGRGAGGYIKQTLVSLRGPRRTYRFDLSGNFPDFKERTEILDLLRTRVATVESNESLSRVKNKQHFAGAMLLIASVVILGLLIAWQRL